ncbi:hypothetical protein VFPPC_18352 [Pochonia chlamydosporia 170]|uniref:Uncharacterized protein n=1 Tax=Pochonia chlamydosporia 170 TaxID=1380566 RepID=A0A179F2W1_METCM|nr:hypothetical protein VFPPC_12067 [Pochonia chlamydosporia 170]XP_022285821.1 hypothetical protein VFPPC_18352 [Pochonia chlamydosporia 170]OAQ59767.2 hypothetical protein VFPPC_12067 [Pochonia chlamydosporia 170]OWT43396.1 hypothetical protein VFPPC_18352 [Pochonia chlamydosporia 170]
MVERSSPTYSCKLWRIKQSCCSGKDLALIPWTWGLYTSLNPGFATPSTLVHTRISLQVFKLCSNRKKGSGQVNLSISNPTKKHRSIQGNTLPSISPFTSRDKDHDLESRYARSSLAQPYSTNLLFSKELCDKVELDGCMTPPAIRAVCRESQWTCGQVGSLVHNICGSRRSGWFNPAIDEVFTKINRRESLPLLIFAWRWEE